MVVLSHIILLMPKFQIYSDFSLLLGNVFYFIHFTTKATDLSTNIHPHSLRFAIAYSSSHDSQLPESARPHIPFLQNVHKSFVLQQNQDLETSSYTS